MLLIYENFEIEKDVNLREFFGVMSKEDLVDFILDRFDSEELEEMFEEEILEYYEEEAYEEYSDMCMSIYDFYGVREDDFI